MSNSPRLKISLSRLTGWFGSCLAVGALGGCGDAGPGPGSPGKGAPAEAEAEAAVPMPEQCLVFRGSPDLAGVVNAGIGLPLELLWEHKAEDPVLASPVSDGENVYIGDGDGNFLCLALSDGSRKWSAKNDGTIESTACISGDRVVVGSTDGFVYAYHRETGAELWKFETLGEVIGGINTFVRTSPEGDVACVVFGSHDNKLYCLAAADGAEQWSVETGYYVNGTPAIHDGKIAFGGCDGFVYVNDAQTGAEIARIEIVSYVSNSIVMRDGNAYVAHYENKVEAFNIAEGRKLWSFEDRAFPYFASPAVTDSMVIAPNQGKRVHAIDRSTGEEVWNFRTAGRADGSPIVAGGHVIFGADDGILYFLEEKTGKEAWRYEIGDEIKSSPAIVRNTLIVGASDGRVYAFRIPEPGAPGRTETP